MIRSVVFFGTPDFAVPTLQALCDAGRRPQLVVSQPDRPAGRRRRLQQPPVARCAVELKLALAQPERLAQIRARLEAEPPDVAVVVAYGKIFPEWLLDLPREGCVNVHASLLPRWRGAAPIQAAIASGDRETGVTTMQMEPSLDTGPILLAESVEIRPDETAPELAPRLARRGARLAVETLDRLEAGDLAATPQPTVGVTYAPRIARRDGIVDWTRSADEIYDRYRAFAGWPGTTAILGGVPLKITDCRPAEAEEAGDARPGEIAEVGEGGLVVVCGGGTRLAITRVQRPGRKELAVADFLRGEPLAEGDRFDLPEQAAAGD